MASDPVWIEAGFGDSVRITKPAAPKASRGQWSQPFPSPAEQAQNGAAIIAGKINGTIKLLPSNRPDNGPGLLETGAPAAAGHSPPFGHPVRMRIDRRELFRCQHMQRTTRVMRPD